MNSESTLSDALSEVDTALAASDNERAAGLASELLLAYPNAVAVLRQRARALTAAGRSLQAAEVHRRVLEILPADGEAMAGLARTLHLAGQHAEARDAARQALDYLPRDVLLSRIAAGDSQPFDPDNVSMQFVKARTDALAGMTQRATAGLHNVITKSPERTDAKIVLMQTLWRKGARIAATEQAQAVLDDYSYCLNAHLLMLDLWRTAGASDMERFHLQVIDQIDPDHRVTHAMLGTQSPLPVKDVPARPAQPSEPATEEDALAREAWVDSLVAASSALPKPLEQPHAPATEPAIDMADDSTLNAEAGSDEPSEFISSLLPLEWSAAGDPSEESAQEDFSVSWIDGNVKDGFSPERPRAAQPDPNDGVPADLPALEWEGAGDEGVAQKDFRTVVDGGIASQAVTPVEEDNMPLKPLAAAGVVTAAVQRNDAAQSQAADAEAQAAPPESAPPQSLVDAKAAQAVQAEVESAAIKPLPIEAIEFVDEDMERWDAKEAQPLPAQETPVSHEDMPAGNIAPAAADETPPEAVPAATVQADDAISASVVKAAALATALSAASKKRKKKAEAEADAPAEPLTPSESPAMAMDAAGESSTLAPVIAPIAPITTQDEPVPQAIAPSAEKPQAKKAPASKAAKPKPAKKSVAKPATRETQTEKVRKTYERAISTAKREDMPKLIKELNQAAERDPDNKIIFELLGQAYNRSGDIPAAISAYRKALALAEHS